MPDIVDGSSLWPSTSGGAVGTGGGLDIVDGSCLWPSTSSVFVPPPVPPPPALPTLVSGGGVWFPPFTRFIDAILIRERNRQRRVLEVLERERKRKRKRQRQLRQIMQLLGLDDLW